jgi:hypothetical protein
MRESFTQGKDERNARKFHFLSSNVSECAKLFLLFLQHCVFMAFLTISDNWQRDNGRVDIYFNNRRNQKR